jgi:hypothetical protein
MGTCDEAVSAALDQQEVPCGEPATVETQSKVSKWNKQPVIEDYDPTRSEYIRPASEREVLEAEVAQLRRQAASLASALEARSRPSSPQSRPSSLVGYRRVLLETKQQLRQAVLRLSHLPPHVVPAGEQEAGGDSSPLPWSKDSWNGAEAASTRASTAVSDLEDLLLLVPEASFEGFEDLLEQESAHHCGGFGRSPPGKGSVVVQESEWSRPPKCSLDETAIHQVCSLFGLPLTGLTFGMCACSES